jgi:hypothetical protein
MPATLHVQKGAGSAEARHYVPNLRKQRVADPVHASGKVPERDSRA